MEIIQAFIFLVLCCTGVAGDCSISDDTCTFYLEVGHKLTMMRYKDLVYPANGKLYKYDVVNTSSAEPIVDRGVISADGWEEPRLVTVVNGTMPGPDIIVYDGQTVIIHVTNALTGGAVTIHWHGLHQRGTPWMDGVPWVTQCPIHPGQTFKYEFKAEPKGTFWYHSHVGAQRSMGTFGAFVIKPRTVSTVGEYIMQIQDWNHDYDSEIGHLKMLFGQFDNRVRWPGTESLDGSFFSRFKFQSGLINGKGRYYDPITGSNLAPLHVFGVVKGRKYRFRVIGTGAMYPFRVSVDSHPLTVVASDGYDLEPVTAESFVINPGERFDFEITANQDVGNYWVRGYTLEQNLDHRAEAILRYEGAPDVDPVTSRWECTASNACLVLNCPFTYYPQPHTVCSTFDDLRSSTVDDPAPGYEEGKFREYFLNFAFPGIKTFPGSVNGRTFDTPTVNPLTQPLEWNSPCEAPACGEERHCKCTHALHIGRGDTVQIVMLNMGLGKKWSHPIHMHGHSFYVLKMGYGHYNDQTGLIEGDNLDVDCRGHPDREKSFCNDATWSNTTWLNGNVPGLELQRPPRKDTIIIPTGGYAVLRLRADNPGLWNMHCHIELHNLDGMQMLVNESFSEVPEPPMGFPECHSYPPSNFRLETLATRQQPSTPSESAEDSIAESAFWAMFGGFVGVVVVQLFIIVGLCGYYRRRKPAKELSGFDNNGLQVDTTKQYNTPKF